MVATLRKRSDALKHAYASFRGKGETLYINTKAGAAMTFRHDWAKGSKHEKSWDWSLGTSESRSVDCNIPEGRPVFFRIGTPGGDDSAYCKGKA